MTPDGITKPSLIDWAVAARPLAGQTVSGDLHLVKKAGNRALLAVVDGVGHGDEATAAAAAAVSILDKYSEEPVISLLNRCHKALMKTRGVVMTLASINAREDTVTWLGVGNVEGRLLRADARHRQTSASVLLRGGLAGYQLPPLQATVIPLAAGDLLIFATDGIDAEFGEEVNLCDPPGQIANRILNKHFKGTDDALALVARYLGMHHE